MPSTTIHIPEKLLKAVDVMAGAEGVSRNRFILRALERVLEQEERWPSAFVDELRTPLSRGDSEAVDRMLEAIQNRRSSKGPPTL